MLLHQRFISNAKKLGNKLAVNDYSTGRKVSYTKALIASLLLVEEFSKYDKGLTGVMVPTSAGGYLAVLAVIMSGRTPVMINYSTDAEENIKYARNKCNFRTVITSKTLLEKINCPQIEGMVFLEDIMAGLSKVKKLKAAIKSKLPESMLYNLIHKGDENDTVVVLFTSGSEKEPKAVQLTHRNIISNIESYSPGFGLNHKDIVLANLPLFHSFGFTGNLWTSFYHGMTIVTFANPLDYKKICNIARNEEPTVILGTPSFFWGYLNKSEPGDFSSIKLALCGADKCPDALREGFMLKHNMVLLEGYGTTETSVCISSNSATHNKPGSTGRPIPGVEVKIVHYETGEDCNVGEEGKILVKGDNVMKGYFDDIEETSLHMRSGWYDTGDMGYLDEEGYLWHSGRLKRFTKVGGEMISLVKVENVLEKYLPEDVLCCVVEIPDSTKGAKIIAVVTGQIDEKAILKEMSKELPNIALPKQFPIMEEFPKMGSGKIDFRSITDEVKSSVIE